MLSKSGLTRYRSAAFALAMVVGIGVFGVPYAAAQNSAWTVTVDVSQQPPQLTVSFTPISGSNCPTAKLNLSKKGNLYGACLGDTVTWTAQKGGSSTKDMIAVFSEDSIFDTSSGDTITGTGSTTSATIISGNPNDTTEYYVAVVDNNTWYTQDPKIIMGTGSNRGPSAEAHELDLLKDQVGLSREEKDQLGEITKELHQQLMALEALKSKAGEEPKPRD